VLGIASAKNVDLILQNTTNNNVFLFFQEFLFSGTHAQTSHVELLFQHPFQTFLSKHFYRLYNKGITYLWFIKRAFTFTCFFISKQISLQLFLFIFKKSTSRDQVFFIIYIYINDTNFTF